MVGVPWVEMEISKLLVARQGGEKEVPRFWGEILVLAFSCYYVAVTITCQCAYVLCREQVDKISRFNQQERSEGGSSVNRFKKGGKTDYDIPLAVL
jgi:hypothetical protein